MTDFITQLLQLQQYTNKLTIFAFRTRIHFQQIITVDSVILISFKSLLILGIHSEDFMQ